MAESAASGPLHTLQSELAGVKSQWEYFADRVINGYKDAYKAHLGALQTMKRDRLMREQQEAQQRGVYMFVLSVVAVGFTGGIVGGLIGPWVTEKGISAATKVVREGVKGAATRTTQQLVKLGVPQGSSPASVDPSPYIPVAPDAFDVYLDKKEELDGCFAEINSWLQRMINMANAENWGGDIGSDILNSFRKNCPLLTDAPDPDKLPERFAAAKSAELAMWIAWAQARDWDWWNKVYAQFDHSSSDLDVDLIADGLRSEQELYPVQARFAVLGKLGLVNISIPGWFDDNLRDILLRAGRLDFDYRGMLDLRKVKAMQLSAMTDLPFGQMKNLDFSRLSNPQLRTKFLDGLSDLRPFHLRTP